MYICLKIISHLFIFYKLFNKKLKKFMEYISKSKNICDKMSIHVIYIIRMRLFIQFVRLKVTVIQK